VTRKKEKQSALFGEKKQKTRIILGKESVAKTALFVYNVFNNPYEL